MNTIEEITALVDDAHNSLDKAYQLIQTNRTKMPDFYEEHIRDWVLFYDFYLWLIEYKYNKDEVNRIKVLWGMSDIAQLFKDERFFNKIFQSAHAEWKNALHIIPDDESILPLEPSYFFSLKKRWSNLERS